MLSRHVEHVLEGIPGLPFGESSGGGGGGDFSSWKAGAESDSVQGAAVSTMNVFPGRCFFSCAPIIFGGPTKTPVHKLRHKSSPGSFA